MMTPRRVRRQDQNYSLVDELVRQRLSAEFAGLFPDAKLVIQPGAGHSPWLDDVGWFAAVVSAFLDEG
jgi:pimeloyl-ACP methyl ester carboxylesterase